jgi:hypothetical protein
MVVDKGLSFLILSFLISHLVLYTLYILFIRVFSLPIRGFMMGIVLGYRYCPVQGQRTKDAVYASTSTLSCVAQLLGCLLVSMVVDKSFPYFFSLLYTLLFIGIFTMPICGPINDGAPYLGHCIVPFLNFCLLLADIMRRSLQKLSAKVNKL